MTAPAPRPRRRPWSILATRLAGFAREDNGISAVMTALLIPVLVGFLGFAIDFGRVYQVQLQLQNAADAAALAGGYNIPNSTAVTTATTYSALTGNNNAFASSTGVTVTAVSGFPRLECLADMVSSIGPCVGTELSGGANAIQVKMNAVVPTYFTRIAGITSVTVQGFATASAKGGPSQALDIMLVVDTTASMSNTQDTSCGLTGTVYKFNCALAGARALLTGLNPALDQVGIMVFPGLTTTAMAAYELNCSTPTIQSYKNSPVYQITALSNDFKTSVTSTTLNASSNNVLATSNNTTCTNTTNTYMDAVGGMGTFYADAITAAQTALTNNGRAHTQKVIVLLSDGDASASSTNMPTGKATNQCHQAITAAQTAATAGTWIYSIAYGASTSSSSSCSTDSPAISACSTMQQIASDSSKFYSDALGGTACPNAKSISNLVSLFSSISADLAQPRLIPNNST